MLEILFCLVVGVSDGDTLRVSCDGDKPHRVRVVAIDAPEVNYKGYTQAYGDEAKQLVENLCLNEVATIKVYYLDRYKRPTADVECKGKDVSEELVKNGLAWVYDRYASKHKHLYQLQDKAKAQRLNIWSNDNPTPPWEWRKR